MKKWTALLLALVLLLCGCMARETPVQTTQPQATTEPPAETTAPQAMNMHIVELTLWVTEENLWTDENQLNAMLAEFNAYYPNILVNVEHVSPDRVGPEKPDLVLADTQLLARWSGEGMMTALDEIWTQTLAVDAYSNVEAACGNGENYFALPLCVVVDCMAIRMSDFARAQATTLINQTSHTWSAANFLQAASNLCDAGMESSLSIYCKDTQGDVYTRLLVENLDGGRFVNTINGTYQLDSREMSAALTKLSTARGIAIRPDQTAADALEAFLAGESAMTLNWNSALQLQYGGDGEILYMLYPSGTRTRTYARVCGLGLFTQEDVQQQAASMTLMHFLSTSDAAVRATNQLPARKSQAKVYDGTELEAAMDDLSRLLGSMTQGEIPGNHWEQARNQWVTLLRQIPGLAGQEPDAEDPLTLADLIAACQEALSQ